MRGIDKELSRYLSSEKCMVRKYLSLSSTNIFQDVSCRHPPTPSWAAITLDIITYTSSHHTITSVALNLRETFVLVTVSSTNFIIMKPFCKYFSRHYLNQRLTFVYHSLVYQLFNQVHLVSFSLPLLESEANPSLSVSFTNLIDQDCPASRTGITIVVDRSPTKLQSLRKYNIVLDSGVHCTTSNNTDDIPSPSRYVTLLLIACFLQRNVRLDSNYLRETRIARCFPFVFLFRYRSSDIRHTHRTIYWFPAIGVIMQIH